MAVYNSAEKALNSQFKAGGARAVVKSAIDNGQITAEEAQTILSALGL